MVEKKPCVSKALFLIFNAFKDFEEFLNDCLDYFFIDAVKSNMRLVDLSAPIRTSSLTNTSLPSGLISASSIACRPFIAIQGQCAQLRHVAPSPAVGASKNSFSGQKLLHLIKNTAISRNNELFVIKFLCCFD